VLPGLFLMLAILAVMIAVLPKEPLTHAMTSIQSPDGQAPEGTPSAIYQGLVISEVMPANSSAVPDENGDFSDWLEVWNSSDHPIDMGGVGLSDRSDRILFLFPKLTLEPNGRTVVFASGTNAADINNAFHAKFKLSSAGETVYLFDPSAYVIHQVTVPILNSDVSYALQADGVTWAQAQEYSPGFENTEEGFLTYRNSNAVSEVAIRINEVMADPRTGIYDEDGELSDWIELYNTTDQNIPLKGLALSDKENDPLMWRFPDGAVIPAHGYYLVFCSGKNRLLDADKISHTNFRLSAERETVILSDSRGRLIDRASIDNLPMDASLGRDESGNWKVFQTATPGMPNNEAGAAQSDRNMRAANTTGVYISEIMASNDDGADWVEMYNSSTQTFYLEGYALSDDLGRPRKWQFPAGASITPGEYKIINLDGTNSQAEGYHTNFKLLRTGGEVMCFSDPNGRVLDKISFSLVEQQWLMVSGPNGAGKSTLANAIVKGVPYEGTIACEGKNIAHMRPSALARSIGVLAQSNQAGYAFSVEEVVNLGRYAYHKGRFDFSDEQGEEKVYNALEITGMLPLAKQSVLTLSGGELQRTFLAQVFAQDPKLLILDEPSNHLDLVYQKLLFELIGKWIQKPGKAVITVIHDLSLARAFGTHALLLHQGKAVASGSTKDVLSGGNLKKVYAMDVQGWMKNMLSQWNDEE
jgi:iron complex transport system ATP-binding protein